MKAFLHLILSCTMLSATGSVKAADTCEVRKLEATRMADLNIPRAGHQVFYAGGELMVAGGHTDGFVPTPTARRQVASVVDDLQPRLWHFRDAEIGQGSSVRRL